MTRTLLALVGVMVCLGTAAAKEITVASPDGMTVANIHVGQVLSYDICQDGVEVLAPSKLSITLGDNTHWGVDPSLIRVRRSSKDAVVASPFMGQAVIEERYNSAVLTFRGRWSVEFRVFDDGVAYRFASTKRGDYTIKSEAVEYCFVDDAVAHIPYVKSPKDLSFEAQFHKSFENIYTVAPLSELDNRRLAFLPVLVDAPQGKRLGITESDLRDYPGLYLNASLEGHRLQGIFAPYPAALVEHTGHNNLQTRVAKRADYIAQVSAPRTFPWRVVTVSRTDVDLANSQLSYLLAEPSKLDDLSWIKPGKVAWDWWNDWNLKGVSFRAGINNQTYKYYIDFASQHNIEYVILDEGWAVNKVYDLMQVVPEIDLEELVAYGAERGVDIILWAGYYAFDRDMENVCRHYAAMGVKGFKIDFMDRDDQQMVAFNERAAQMAAKYHLVLDLHGTYKPAGLQRTYPNILNFEGVYGLEQMKWRTFEEVDMVTFDVSIPFIRLTSGPMDYTQGAMRNANRANYYPSTSRPMSQGTRAHQVAQYIIYLAPLNMMCDSPSNYEANASTTKLISAIPTTWDESRTLEGSVGEYIVTMRRHGDDWYIAGLNNWTEREITLDLTALSGITSGNVTYYRDGINADRNAEDFILETLPLTPDPVTITMAPGGGFLLHLTPN